MSRARKIKLSRRSILKRHGNGETHRQIAESIGVGASTLSRFLASGETSRIVRPRNGKRPTAPDLNPPPAPQEPSAKKQPPPPARLGPGDLEVLARVVSDAFYRLEAWLSKPGLPSDMGLEARAEALGIPYDVACLADERLGSLGYVLGALERLPPGQSVTLTLRKAVD